MHAIKVISLCLILLLSACYGVNSETSEIGSMSPTCLDSLAWTKLCQTYSIDSIKDSSLLSKLEDVKNHFIQPKYILYFKDEPEEIIGCDWYAIRVVYNKKIADQTLDGLDPLLGNAEQKRVRNRVLQALLNYQCEAGKKETLKAMAEAVPFAESHKAYPLKPTPEMMEAKPMELKK